MPGFRIASLPTPPESGSSLFPPQMSLPSPFLLDMLSHGVPVCKSPKYTSAPHSLPELPSLASHAEPSFREESSLSSSCFRLPPSAPFTKGSGAGESSTESFKRRITKCPRNVKWEKNWKETIGSGISESWMAFSESHFSELVSDRITEETTIQRMEWTTHTGKWH